MRTIKAIREEKARLADEAEALLLLAAKENREPTAEEQATIDGIVGKGKRGTDDYVPGKIDALNDEEARVENFERIKAQLAERRSAEVPTEGDREKPEENRLARVKVPTRARFHHANLKAFRGQHAEEAAYLTGQFLLATIGQSNHAKRWCKEHGVDTRYRGALKESDNSLGGFLVPVEMERSIITLREERGVLRREAMVVPMASDTLHMPRRASGVTAYWTGETAEITASNPTLNNVELTVKKLAALVRMSSEVNEDTVISLADFIVSEIAYAFADKEDQAGFNGDGTSTYGNVVGIKNALQAGSEHEAAAGNTAFSTLDLDDFEAMVGKLPQYALQNAKWYISRAGWAASMQRLLDAAGGNTIQTLSSGANAMFLGFPVVWTQVMNSTLTAQTSTEGLCYFGDLRQGVKLGNRRGMAIATSTDRYFETDEIGIKATERVDIVVSEPGDSNNPGSIIGLKTPSS